MHPSTLPPRKQTFSEGICASAHNTRQSHFDRTKTWHSSSESPWSGFPCPCMQSEESSVLAPASQTKGTDACLFEVGAVARQRCTTCTRTRKKVPHSRMLGYLMHLGANGKRIVLFSYKRWQSSSRLSPVSKFRDSLRLRRAMARRPFSLCTFSAISKRTTAMYMCLAPTTATSFHGERTFPLIPDPKFRDWMFLYIFTSKHKHLIPIKPWLMACKMAVKHKND